MGVFVIKRTSTGFKFDLKTDEGDILSTSEVYVSKSACIKGIKSVVKNAAIAKTEDHTQENYTIEKNPKFEIYKDKGKGFRFRLKAKNGEIITISKAYGTKKSCETGLKNVVLNAEENIIEE